MTTRELASEDIVRIVSALPSDLKEMLKRNAFLWLAGGAVRALVAGEPVSDYDLFGPNEPTMKNAANELHKTRVARGFATKLHATDNAITVLTLGRTPVQFITRWAFPSAAAVIASFDFTVAQAAVWYDGGWETVCSDAFYPDLAARRLTYTAPTRDEDACGSLLRVRRFLKKGYTIQASSLAGAIARAVCATKKLGITLPEAEVATLLAEQIREVDPLVVVDGVELQPDHFVEQ